MKKLLLVSGVVICLAIGIAVVAITGFPHVIWFYTARNMMPEKEYGFMYEKPIKRTVASTTGISAQYETFDYGSLVFKTSWPTAKQVTKLKNGTTGKGIVSPMFYDKRDMLYEAAVKGMNQQEIDVIISTMRGRRRAD